jgi:hypothetical protein
MYLFLPHGSRNILDIVGVSNKTVTFYTPKILPLVLCHDQEPLNYRLYQNHSDDIISKFSSPTAKRKISREMLRHSNLKLPLGPWFNIYDQIMLLHSEKNSQDLEWYEQNGFVGIHYWSHSVIAKDWYRFANHDKRLNCAGPVQQNFLIYCRDWSGTREYRIKFQELLIKHNLYHSSITKMMKTNSEGVALRDHVFANQQLSVTDVEVFDCINDNDCKSSDSANYCPDDINQSKISVVLETIFDSTKIHLTEKTLRPIACGHPFILAAGAGSLEYLRSYGFKTFAPWIDESYDLETDSVRRLEKIIASMQQFANLSNTEQQHVMLKIKEIANFNQKWFFSSEFDQVVVQELESNIKQALIAVNTSRGKNYLAAPQQKFKDNQILRKMVLCKLKQLRQVNRTAQ